MNLTGDPISADEAYEYGLVNRVVPDHELFDAALAWARKLAGQAPLALEQIKRVSHAGDLDEGIEAEKAASRRPSPPRTPARASPPSWASARRSSRGSERAAARLAELIRSARLGRRADGRRDLGAVGDPRLPLAGHGPVGERRPDGGRAHLRLPARPGAFWGFYGQRFAALDGKQPNGAHRALVELERRGPLDAVITQNIDGLHARGGHRDPIEVHGSIAHASCLDCGASSARGGARAAGGRRRGDPALRLRAAAEARRRAVRRAAAGGGDRARATRWPRAPTCCCASAPRSRSGRSPSCRRSRSTRAARRDRHDRPDALRPPRGGQALRRRGRRARGGRRRARGERPASQPPNEERHDQ